ncbi:MAG: hypothetical protein AB7S26_32960 [Sandaracinaceae bacterium]
MAEEGHDPGHPLTWGALLTVHRERLGGWTGLAEELVRRGGGRAQLPDNLATLERGLRRLAQKGHAPGGQYGRWVERFLGLPPETEPWLRWLGQYHSRFADLPVSLRRRQLELWDRPPVAGSASGIWIDLGMASVGFRAGDDAMLRARLDRAGRAAPRASVAARIEHALLRARVNDPDGRWLEAAEDELAHPELAPEDRASYRARTLDARAYRAMRASGRIEDGRALYEAIDIDTGIPFVDFRRALGLAYCAWKLGQPHEGERLALEAAEHAADGGLVRFRAMAFNLASRIALGDAAVRWRARAGRLGAMLEDEELLARVAKRDGPG